MAQFIFDIDGTLGLFRTGGSALWLTLQEFAPELADLPDAQERIKGIHKAGRTDPDIINQLLTAFGLAQEYYPWIIEIFLIKYTELIAQGEATPCGKIQDLLQQIDNDKYHKMYILSGNMEQTGRAKLQRLGMEHFFAAGAYGSDSRERNDLLPILMQKIGLKITPELMAETFIIGDTPHDIAVARAHGALAVAIACGTYDGEALLAAEPDLLLHQWQGAKDLVSIEQLLD